MLNMLTRFWQPKEVVTKKGSIARLRYLEAKKVALVCGRQSIDDSGVLGRIESYFEVAKIDRIVCRIGSEPEESMLRILAEEISDYEPDWIVACGGGAVLDSAKLAWAAYEWPPEGSDGIAAQFVLKGPKGKARFAAIPTTSGSGSEASIVAVFKEDVGQRKLPVVSEYFIPDLCILDPSTTIGLPADITVYTAIDAFTHAVESYCSTMNNHLSNSYSVLAATLILQNLPVVLATPEDIVAREKLQHAAFFAGVAQNTTSVGATHALAHAVGSLTGIPHGWANAIFLPEVLRLNAEESSRPSDFARSVGLADLHEIYEWLQRVMDIAGLLSDWRLVSGDVDRETPGLVDLASSMAADDICLKTNPIKVNKEMLATLLEKTS